MKRFPWFSLALLLMCYAGFGWYLSGFETSHPRWLVSGCFQLLGAPTPKTELFNERPKSTEAEMIERMIGDSQKASPPTIGLKSETSPADATDTDALKAAPTPNPETAEPRSRESSERSPTVRSSATLSGSEQTCNLVFRHNLPISLVAVTWIFISSAAFVSPLTSFNRFISRWFHSDTIAVMAIFTFAGMAAVILFWLHVFLQILTILAAEALARIDIQNARMTGNQAYWILSIVSLTGLTVGWLANGVL